MAMRTFACDSEQSTKGFLFRNISEANLATRGNMPAGQQEGRAENH
jgi:hypothetical protein